MNDQRSWSEKTRGEKKAGKRPGGRFPADDPESPKPLLGMLRELYILFFSDPDERAPNDDGFAHLKREWKN
ncbi:hypothetical protein M1555_01900 [Patescibacteria group bacterium]|nr:hypothetical protein [Patescibacteria group bacterium]